MTTNELSNLKIGDIVFVVIHPTMISKYQYVGIFTEHTTQETKRVFLSPYFLSTVTLLYGREKQSMQWKNIFLTESEARANAHKI